MNPIFMTIKPIIKPRSLQGIGHSWFISLPREWISHHSLRKKDKISISLNSEDCLILRVEND